MSTHASLPCASCGDGVAVHTDHLTPVTLCGACTPADWDGATLPEGAVDWAALEMAAPPKVMEIPLSRGLVAIVDAADYPELSKHKWHAIPHGGNWYAYRTDCSRAKSTNIQMHRQIMNVDPVQFIDHRDGNGLNNTRANLRIATRSQNGANRRRNPNKTIPFKGVFWHKPSKRYCVHIEHEGRRIWVGRFSDPAEAAKAYDDKVRELCGEFACVNFPREGERAA